MQHWTPIAQLLRETSDTCGKIIPREFGKIFEGYLTALIHEPRKPPMTNSWVRWQRVAQELGLERKAITETHQKKLLPLLRRIASNVNFWDPGSADQSKQRAEVDCNPLVDMAQSLVNSGIELVRQLRSLEQSAHELAVLRNQKQIETAESSVSQLISRAESFSHAVSVLLDSYSTDIDRMISRPDPDLGMINISMLRRWASGKSAPRSTRSLKIVSILENEIGLPQFSLLSKLESISPKFSPLQFSDRTHRVVPIPSNPLNLHSGDRDKLKDWVENDVGPQATPYGLFLSRAITKPYAIIFRSQLPTARKTSLPRLADRSLEEEVDAFVAHMTTTFVPLGMIRKEAWRKSTARIRQKQIRLFLGVLHAAPDYLPGGRGIPISDLTLGLLAFPSVVDAYLKSCELRRKFITSSEENTLALLMVMLHQTSGWLCQNPHLADRIRPTEGLIDAADIEEALRDWKKTCEIARTHLAMRMQEISLKKIIHRSTFNRIMSILEADDPFSKYMKIPAEIIRRAPDPLSDPLGAAEAARGDMMTTIGIYSGLRCGNLATLRLRAKGQRATTLDDLHRLEAGEIHWNVSRSIWTITVPISAFKNARSLVWKDGPYIMDLPDDGGLYSRIEEYINTHRLILMGAGADPGTFFVKTCKASTDVLSYSSEAYSEAFRGVIARYGVRNPVTGRGALADITAFGPHCCRDIRATQVLKAGGSFEEAAFAICDSEATVRKHYARFAPENRLKSVSRFFVLRPGNEQNSTTKGI